MKSYTEILKEAHQRINDALLVTSWWRANEVRDNYALIEGDQWLEDAFNRQNSDGMPVHTINKISPVVDAICGFEIQNRPEVNYIPRINDKTKEGFTDLINDAVNYIQDECQSGFHDSQAFRDTLICGVGATRTTMSYDNNPDGEVEKRRIFPYLTLWDVAARRKNIIDANWVIEAKVVDKDTLADYIKNINDADEVEANFGAAGDARFLDFFNTVMITKSLAVIYHYEWREKVEFYRIDNPLMGFEGDPSDPYVQNLVTLARVLQDKFNCDVFRDRIFSIEKEDYKTIKEAFELVDLPFKATKQKKFKYYSAIFTGNKFIEEPSENFSQKGFGLKFMTGKFSEIRQCYFGYVRAAKEAQRLLNQSISDLDGFLRTVPKGGVYMEADAVPNQKAFLDTWVKAREVTFVSPGAISANKIMPKPVSPVPPGLFEMINLASQYILETAGITPDFMGLTDSKLMTAALNSQLVRQGLMVLTEYFDAKKFYTIEQGKLFIDCIRIMAENAEGRLFRVIDKGEYKYIPLLKNNIAAEYDVIVQEIPQTINERQQTFEKLIELQGMLAKSTPPVNIMPIVLEYSPLKENQIEKVNTLMQPPPPPQPDPLTQGLLQAETQLKQSTAEKNMAESIKTRMDVLLKQKELENADEILSAELQKIMADAKLSNSKAISNLI